MPKQCQSQPCACMQRTQQYRGRGRACRTCLAIPVGYKIDKVRCMPTSTWLSLSEEPGLTGVRSVQSTECQCNSTQVLTPFSGSNP